MSISEIFIHSSASQAVFMAFQDSSRPSILVSENIYFIYTPKLLSFVHPFTLAQSGLILISFFDTDTHEFIGNNFKKSSVFVVDIQRMIDSYELGKLLHYKLINT